MFIYIYIWYVRIPYMHSALYVCDAIFPHVIQERAISVRTSRPENESSRVGMSLSANYRDYIKKGPTSYSIA